MCVRGKNVFKSHQQRDFLFVVKIQIVINKIMQWVIADQNYFKLCRIIIRTHLKKYADF